VGHNQITFSMLYAYHENFILPFSHDEVVHGKGSMIDKMPGDSWQKAPTCAPCTRTCSGTRGRSCSSWAMSSRSGASGTTTPLDWGVLGDPLHAGLQRWVRDLNHVYAGERSLWEVDADGSGFAWIDCHDHDNSVISFLRRGASASPAQPTSPGAGLAIVVVNFTPVPRAGYRIGVPRGGTYVERLNSDAEAYGGSNVGNGGRVVALDEPRHDHPHTLSLTVPPLGCLVLTPEG
jgi:1,4-alpha-glucan branching enzyme